MLSRFNKDVSNYIKSIQNQKGIVICSQGTAVISLSAIESICSNFCLRKIVFELYLPRICLAHYTGKLQRYVQEN